jgi:hypothetical protein
MSLLLYYLGAFNPRQPNVATGFIRVVPMAFSISAQDTGSLLAMEVMAGSENQFRITNATFTSGQTNCQASLVGVYDGNKTVALAFPFTLPPDRPSTILLQLNSTSCKGGNSTKFSYKATFTGVDEFGNALADSGVFRGTYN